MPVRIFQNELEKKKAIIHAVISRTVADPAATQQAFRELVKRDPTYAQIVPSSSNDPSSIQWMDYCVAMDREFSKQISVDLLNASMPGAKLAAYPNI